jgi:hypothetical protein
MWIHDLPIQKRVLPIVPPPGGGYVKNLQLLAELPSASALQVTAPLTAPPTT